MSKVHGTAETLHSDDEAPLRRRRRDIFRFLSMQCERIQYFSLTLSFSSTSRQHCLLVLATLLPAYGHNRWPSCWTTRYPYAPRDLLLVNHELLPPRDVDLRQTVFIETESDSKYNSLRFEAP